MSEIVEKTFSESLGKNLDVSILNSESQKYLKELAKQQSSDFTVGNGEYFSNESQELLARESANRLAKALAARGTLETLEKLDRNALQEEWQKIVVDFHRSDYWGQPTQKQRPPKILTEEQKRTRELFPYIWTAFQALIAMKLVISYFGLESADNPGETPWFLYFSIAFSFFSLVFFAWRKFRKGE